MKNMMIILWKEALEIFRNRRALFVMIVVPIVLYPLMMLGFGYLTFHQMRKIQQKVYVVAMSEGVDPVKNLLAADSQFVLVPLVESSDSSLLAGDIELIVDAAEGFLDSIATGGNSSINLSYDGSSEKSEAARVRVEALLGEYSDSIVAGRLEKRGLPKSIIHPIDFHTENRASPKRMGGWLFGRILAFVLVTMVISGAYNGAADMFAGERERGTLETILVAPISRIEIVLGKFIAVFLFTLFTAILNLVSMTVTLGIGLGIAGGSNLPIQFEMSFPTLLVLLGSLIPLSALFAALFLLISAYARNFKEAQSYLTPIFFIVYIPSMISMLPGVESGINTVFIPVVNIVLLIKKVLLGVMPVTEIILAILATAIYALIAILITAKLLTKEEALFPEDKLTFFRMVWGAWRKKH